MLCSIFLWKNGKMLPVFSKSMMQKEDGMLRERLAEQGVLILDGALATELECRGCNLQDSLWSAKVLMEEPEKIRQVHEDYFRAGANIGISASYQASVQGFLERGYSAAQAREWIRASVRLLREAGESYWQAGGKAAGRPRPIAAASIGPYGAYLADGSEYRGDYGISEEALVAFHAERLRLLEDAGADLFACETIPSLGEAKAILRAMAQQGCTLPCWMSFSCRDGAHICEGAPIAACAEFLDAQDRVEAIGVNCTAPEYIEGLIREIRRASDKPIVVYGNSGEAYDPAAKVWHGRETAPCYADWAPKWYAAGARILGGCCRTTPADIAAIYAWRAQMQQQ